MRIALVRGHQLNPYEMQSYAPLLARGFDLTAFASARPSFELPNEVRVVSLPSPMDAIERSHGLARRAREALAYRRGTATRLEGLEKALAPFDVIHGVETFHAHTGQCLDAASAGGKPVVLTVWENIPHLPVEPPFARIRQRALRGARAFLAVTQRARDALVLEGAPPDRVHVVPVGVDLQRFRPVPRAAGARATLGLPEDALVLLFAARLTWEKGLLDVLHAMRLQDLSGGPAAGAHLVVVGAGPQEPEARARAEALGLKERVRFAGHVPYARMQEWHRAADALVLGSIPTPRWQEQYGMVLVEAMASGLPVVTAASGSIPEVVGDAGLLVQPNDPRSFSDALASIADASTRAVLSKKGRERAERMFDRERVADQVAAIYRAL